MRGTSLLIGTCLTVAYGYAAQAAIAADRLQVVRRLDPAALVVEAPEDARVWNGGTLAPITVEASRIAPAPLTRCSAPGVVHPAAGTARVS